MITEKEARIKERCAFKAGAVWAWDLKRSGVSFMDHPQEAAKRYPLTETRPRVWLEGKPAVSRLAWKYENGELWYCWASNLSESKVPWMKADRPNLNPERIVAWADLIQNPTEEVAI